MSKNKDKTNVMRILDLHKVQYKPHSYVNTAAVDGASVAEALGEDPDRCFKTLVTEDNNGENFVFLVPVAHELDLKKCARAVGAKKISMISNKRLLPLTGYIHGGCSPIGMKKEFVTTIDSSAENFATIYFSGGKIGYQVEVSLSELRKVLDFQLADIKTAD